MKSCVFLDKGFDPRSIEFYKKIKSNNHLIISLDEEGAIDADDQVSLVVAEDGSGWWIARPGDTENQIHNEVNEQPYK